MQSYFRFFSLLAIVFFLVNNSAFSQTNSCPPNIDFEQGTFNHWQCFKGVVTSLGVDSMIPSTPVTAVTNRHTMTPTSYNGVGGLDPYGNFPVVCPNGSGFSVKLGNDSTGAQAERMRYYIHVPNVPNWNILYQYAVVFENPPHQPYQQPKFTVTIYDSATGLNVPCATFDYTATAGLPGFLTSSIFQSNGDTIYYKPWTPAYINFKGLANKTMVLEFTTHDCTLGGHFGYGYVDVNSGCGTNAITPQFCPGDTQAVLHAPPSFQHYVWMDSSLTTVIDTVADLLIHPAPTVPTWYALAIFPYPGFGCADTIWTLLTPQQNPTANFGLPDNYCAGSVVQLSDSSYSNTNGTYISNWLWNFGDVPSSISIINPNTDTIKNPTHIYYQYGNYTVCLGVKNSVGCASDTVCKLIHINQPPPPLSMAVTKDTICGPNDTTSVYLLITGPIPSGFTNYYTLDTSTYLVSGSLNSTLPIKVTFTKPGLHYITYDIQPPPSNDTSCWAHDYVAIYVKGITPAIGVTGSSPVCPNTPDTLSTFSSPANCGPSPFTCSNPPSYVIGTDNSPNVNGTPSPFMGSRTEARIQMLYLASELHAMGMQAGTISDVIFDVTNKNSNIPYQGYSIKMACVNYDSFATNTLDKVTPKTLVYYSTNYNTVVGANLFHLNTPYSWDGVSNLLVETCYDNGSNNNSGSDRTKRSLNPPNQNLCVYARSDNDPLAGCATLYPGSGSTQVATSADRPDIVFKACVNYISPSTTYSWTSNPTGTTGTGSALPISPSTTTTYTVVANDNGCTFTKNYIQVVKPTQNLVATLDTTFLCNIDTLQLNALLAGYSNAVCGTNGSACTTPYTFVLGNGTVTNNPQVTPFRYSELNSRMLMRYKATEMAAVVTNNAAHPVTISKLAYNIVNHSNGAHYTNLTISMGCYPPASAMPSSFVGGLTQVYSNANYVSTSGWNTFTLANKYDWDGVNDVLIEICYSNSNSNNDDEVERTTTTANTVLYSYNSSGSGPAGCVAPAAAPNTFGQSTSRPNCRFFVCDRNNVVPTSFYQWSSTPAAVYPNQPSLQVVPSVTTTYVVTINSPYYCPKNDTIVATVANHLSPYANNDTAVCPGNTVQLHCTAYGAISYSWVSMNGNSLTCTSCQNPVLTVTNIDTIIVTATAANGCFGKDTVYISFPPSPTPTFTVTSPVCLNANSVVTYTGNGLASSIFNWNFGGGTANPGGTVIGPHNVSFSTPGMKTIKLTVNQGGCVSVIDSQHIQVVPQLTSTFSKNSPHCLGDTLTLTYTGSSSGVPGINFVWNTPGGTQIGSGQTIKVVYPTAGWHVFSLTTDVGPAHICPSTTTDSIRLFTYPTASFTATSPICLANSSTVTYTGNGSAPNTAYSWNFAGGTATPGGTLVGPHTVNWATSGIHVIYLTATNNGFCSKTDSQAVQVVPALTSNFSMNNPHCIGDTLFLNYTGTSGSVPNLNYVWNTPGGTQTGTGPNIFVLYGTSGQHIFTLTTSVGVNHICPSTTTDTATILFTPTSSFTTISPVCLNSNSLITYTGTGNASSSYTWNWNGGNATPGGNSAGPHNVNWSTPGLHTVHLTVQNGICSTSDSGVVNVIPQLTSNFSFNTAHCLGDTVVVTYTGTSGSVPNITFNWSSPGGVQIGSGTSIKIVYNTTGMHIVTLQTDVAPNHICPSITKDTIMLYPVPVASFTLSPTVVCGTNNSTATFTGTATGSAVYNWNWAGGTAVPGGTTQGPHTVSWAVPGIHNVILNINDNGCFNADTQQVQSSPALQSSFTMNTPHCVGDNLTVTYTGNSGAVPNVNFIWKDKSNVQIANTIGPHTITVTNPGWYVVHLTVSVGPTFSCPVVYSDSIFIYPIPVANFVASPNPICSDQTATFTSTSTTNAAGGVVTYNWSFTAGLPATASTLGPHTVFYNNPTVNTQTYPASLTVTQDGCTSAAFTSNITVHPRPNAFIKDQVICLGAVAVVKVQLSGAPGASYLWSNGSTTDSTFVTGGIDTALSVIVTDTNGCFDTAHHVVNTPVWGAPHADVGPDLFIFYGDSTELNASASLPVGSSTFHWSPGQWVTDSTALITTAFPDTTTQFVFTLIDVYGCEDKDTIIVHVDDSPFIVLPNAFTPNGDGENDIYILLSRKISKLYYFNIYNRWGEKIFSTDDVKVGWDGTYKGVPQEAGTYVYVVHAKDARKVFRDLKGNFMLIR